MSWDDEPDGTCESCGEELEPDQPDYHRYCRDCWSDAAYDRPIDEEIIKVAPEATCGWFGDRSRCRDCGAEIRWVTTVNGKRMPLDLAPSIAGNVTLRHGLAIVLAGEVLEFSRQRGETLYRAHFVDCPAAAQRRAS
jgi:hypothetical protein